MMSTPDALPSVPGAYVSAGIQQLGECGPDSMPQSVDIDAGVWGRFRIRYQPFRYRRHRSADNWIWVAATAERLEFGK